MKDDYCEDIENIYDSSNYDDSPPDLGNTESAILFELLVKRSSYIFEEDYLLFGKSSYGDLKDGDAAVSQERESDDKVSYRHLQVDGIESNEESDGPRTRITHKDFAGEEVEDKICRQAADHDDADRNTVPRQRSVEVSGNGQRDYRKDRKRAGQTVYAVRGIGGIDRYHEKDDRKDVEHYGSKEYGYAVDPEPYISAESEQEADEAAQKGQTEIKCALDVFVPGLLGTVIEKTCDHCEESQSCTEDQYGLELIEIDAYHRYKSKDDSKIESRAGRLADVYFRAFSKFTAAVMPQEQTFTGSFQDEKISQYIRKKCART